MEAVDIYVDATIALPRWTTREQASKRLREHWDRFEQAVRKHEDGHHAIGLQMAEELLATLTPMRSSEGCKALGAAMRDVQRKYRALGKDYDRETNHGMKDGAVF